MSPPENIFLIGPMGAGKTTIGRQLARRLGKNFIDSDREIEERTGATIPLIFELEGEHGFRDREQAVLDDITRHDNIILATGGGAILRAENREYLKSRGTVIYLHANIEHLLRRTSKDKNRPLLQTDNPRQKLLDLMKDRDPLYRETANIIVETNDRSVRSVVNFLVKRLKEQQRQNS